MSNINYILPDFLCCGRNEIFIDIYKNHKEITREDTSIYSFYGTFPNAIWNSGSVYLDYENTSVAEMKKVRDFYNKRGIVITFTFTNSLLTEEHLDDEYCNTIMEVFDNGMNEVLVVSPILEKYIRESYPKYKINRSIIATEKEPFKAEGYNLSVISKFKNRDFKYLESLSKEEREKTELLCNEYCVNNCPFAYEHYKEYAYLQLHKTPPANARKDYSMCRYKEESFQFIKKRLLSSDYRITYDDIVNKYVPMGFKYFKLASRGKFNFSTLESLIEYLIKPEYQMDVRLYIEERMHIEHQSWCRDYIRRYPNFRQRIESQENII